MRPVAIDCRVEAGIAVVRPVGTWRLACLADAATALEGLSRADAERAVLEGSLLESIDTAGASLLLHRLSALGWPAASLSRRGFLPAHDRLLALLSQRLVLETPVPLREPGLLHRVGAATSRVAQSLHRGLAFTGRVVLALLRLPRRPSPFRPRETVAQLEAVCVDAIPIVLLVNFLIGVVVAYVLGVEAQRYGAGLFVADGIALAVCRELSSILGSVLVAGRSGAAFTAEIGTMKVEEEVDAIATLGLDPYQVLVVPRLLALVVALPLLVLVGDLAGLAGGALVGATQLGIPPGTFLDRVHSALEMRHFVVGLAKAPVFAALIAMVACRMGLEVTGDARGVGRNTTSTVVQCIVWVFVLDALFAALLQGLGV